MFFEAKEMGCGNYLMDYTQLDCIRYILRMPTNPCVFVMTAKDCGSLQSPANGSTVGSETTFPNEIKFICDQGFVLNGSSSRRCLANGSWSGDITLCKGKAFVGKCSCKCGCVESGRWHESASMECRGMCVL